jgi:hypothetical protein
MQDRHIIPVYLLEGGQVVDCPPLMESFPDLPPDRTSTALSSQVPNDQDDDSSETKDTASTSSRRRIRDNPFAAWASQATTDVLPPTKKGRAATAAAISTGTTSGVNHKGSLSGSKHPPSVTIPQLQEHDRFPELNATVATAESDSQWTPPFTLCNHPQFPPYPFGRRSHALATAVHQHNAILKAGMAIAAITKEIPATFEFSRDLMLSSCVTKDHCWRLAFWLSYRGRTANDEPMVTLTLPITGYPDKYSLVPGRLCSKLASMLKTAFQKSGCSYQLV